jgi:hypothetical protein
MATSSTFGREQKQTFRWYRAGLESKTIGDRFEAKSFRVKNDNRLEQHHCELSGAIPDLLSPLGCLCLNPAPPSPVQRVAPKPKALWFGTSKDATARTGSEGADMRVFLDLCPRLF